MKKSTNKYYFSVEGETEHWYLKWLQGKINATDAASHKVSIHCPVQKNPVKYAKTVTVPYGTKREVYHLSDYESDEPVHVKGFQDVMNNMKEAQKLKKQITYKFGYSNLTFELWIILHRMNCNTQIVHRSHYIKPLNQAYKEHFESLDEYKHEGKFIRLLSTLELTNVRDAIGRSKSIMKRNQDNKYVLQEHKGYSYYKENPSLMVHEAIEKILLECGLL